MTKVNLAEGNGPICLFSHSSIEASVVLDWDFNREGLGDLWTEMVREYWEGVSVESEYGPKEGNLDSPSPTLIVIDSKMIRSTRK